MLKKITITVLILILVAVSNLCADDGSWSRSFTIESGSIYSESDDTDIELTKEILIFNGEYTKAVFQFRNTTNSPVTISCGFPVSYKIDAYSKRDHLEIPVSPYGYNDAIPALKYLETLPLEGAGPEDDFIGLYPEIILINSFNNSREFISPGDVPADLAFKISQDSKSVLVQKVLLERHAGEDGAQITFHYKHELVFKPLATSTVVVEYRQDLFNGNDGMGNSYIWNYVIGTGGTWKGPIGELILIKPADWYGNTEGMNIFLEDKDIAVLKAVRYEPSRDEVFSLRGFSANWMEQHEYFENEFPHLKKIWIDRSLTVTQPAVAVQNFITDITASSFLPDKISVFTNDGVISKADFSPAAAFDGIAGTSWCENVQGDGIGQYLEFSLTKKVWGLSISNGFTRLPLKDWLFNPNRVGKTPFDEKVRDDSKGFKDYFTQNNRIKKLSVTDSAGNILYTLELEDQRDSQAFPGINLTPGSYRLVIEDIYPGTKWQDTCLGEVTFLETDSNPQLSRFTADPFYMEALKGVSYK